ncbi:MAG: cytochrome P460 family protein, partial [Chloroflexi bacterium]|nr:cytochrome P460 family protein [Chloroflexota bacterium]
MPCDAGALTVSQVQPSSPTASAALTPPLLAPTLDPAAPTPTARPPTATPRPAPQTDRVGFPEGYQDKFKFLFLSDRVATKQVRQICGNDIATSAKPGEPLPYGSVLIFESWRIKEDPQGNVIKDSNGHLIRETLTTIFVMRKEKGFGEAYQSLRNGEWEYVAYRADKAVQTPPANTANCASCHLAAKDFDYILRTDLWASKDRYGTTPPVGANEVGMASVAFAPNAMSVKVGTSVRFTNSDNLDHTAVALDGSFNSGVLKPGQNFSVTFAKAGTYNFVCALHPEQMSGRV